MTFSKERLLRCCILKHLASNIKSTLRRNECELHKELWRSASRRAVQTPAGSITPVVEVQPAQNVRLNNKRAHQPYPRCCSHRAAHMHMVHYVSCCCIMTIRPLTTFIRWKTGEGCIFFSRSVWLQSKSFLVLTSYIFYLLKYLVNIIRASQ